MRSLFPAFVLAHHVSLTFLHGLVMLCGIFSTQDEKQQVPWHYGSLHGSTRLKSQSSNGGGEEHTLTLTH